MKSVIPQDDLRYSVALCPRYAEKVHRRVGESHEQLYRFCLLLHEKVGMRRNHRSETALSEVEENVLVGIVKVRIETHKHAEAQHKYKVEVGIAALYAVKIDDAFLYKFKQVAVFCLVFCGMNEKLRKKHRYGEFCRREGNRNKSSRKACIAQMLQLHSWAIVKFYVEQSQRLEKLLLQFAPRSLRNPYNKRCAPENLSKHIDNKRLLTIFQRVENYSLSIAQHRLKSIEMRVIHCKNTKNHQNIEKFCQKIWWVLKKDLPLHPQLNAMVPSSIG